MLKLSLTQRFWKIFSTIWLWKISMWPLNYQHILASVIRYVRTKWVASNIFCVLVRLSILEHHHQQGKCSCFLPIWICRIQWLCSLFPISTTNTFLGKFDPKNQNCQFILKFGTWTNSNMQNSMAMFNFSAFYWNYPFWANLVQLIKIVRLSWNLVPRLIRIRRI